MNEGKWLGIGGHIIDGESPDEALIREVKEETGLDLLIFNKRGIIEFVNDDYKEIMHLYVASKFKGTLTPCDEGELKWIDKDKILCLNIWQGDRLFLNKLVSSNDFIKLRLIYKNDEFIRGVEL